MTVLRQPLLVYDDVIQWPLRKKRACSAKACQLKWWFREAGAILCFWLVVCLTLRPSGPLLWPRVIGWNPVMYGLWTRWNNVVWCQLKWNEGPCPQIALSFPSSGCDAGVGRLLLTADGLLSSTTQHAFQSLLAGAAEARTRVQAITTLQRTPQPWHPSNCRSNAHGERAILYVQDAAYVNYVENPSLVSYISPTQYCNFRTRELVRLGASHVTCVLLDPAARLHESRFSNDPGYAEHMRALTDDKVLRRLCESAAVYVEGGNAFFAISAMRRALRLAQGAELSVTFEQALRDRVLDGAGSLVYVGASAGSTIAGSDLFMVMPATHKELLRGDWRGLRLLPNCTILPHAFPRDGAYISKFSHNGLSENETLRLSEKGALSPLLPPGGYGTQNGNGLGIMGIPQCQPIVGWGRSVARERMQYVCP